MPPAEWVSCCFSVLPTLVHTRPLLILGIQGRRKGGVEAASLRSLHWGNLIGETLPGQPFFLNVHSSSLPVFCKFILVLFVLAIRSCPIYVFTYVLSLCTTCM